MINKSTAGFHWTITKRKGKRGKPNDACAFDVDGQQNGRNTVYNS